MDSYGVRAAKMTSARRAGGPEEPRQEGKFPWSRLPLRLPRSLPHTYAVFVSVKRRALIALAVLVVVAIVAVGLLQSDSGSTASPEPLTADQVTQGIAGAPAPLAAVHAQRNRLLGGGKKALDARIRALRGHPVVVNVWGSWCDPCRAEAPILQRVAVEHANDVAFFGIDTQDPAENAERFLRTVPLSYPSYQDLRGKVANGYGLTGTPSTIFYNAKGDTFLHAGVYHSEADLEADLRKYALGA
jgi:cytochrome c biogenesis protein CcmG, thiol:disulfide interchange protein DsbE